MLNGRVKKLEKKHDGGFVVCIVMPGETKKDAISRSQVKLSNVNDIFFIKIEAYLRNQGMH